MLANRSSGVTTSSTMQGATYQAGIDDADMMHMMMMFTDLYSDTELACLREYSTNARDAQIEAGVTRPIEVRIPSALSSFLVIQDFGIGLSADDIAKVYSRYGRSTKRESNDYNGMLGIGCKSALTYAQNFTVESNKDGVKTLCSITRVDNGVPQFQVVLETETDEPNGTIVSIPARRGHEFARKAAELYRFWPEGSVLVDGQAPKRLEGLDLGKIEFVAKWDFKDDVYRQQMDVTASIMLPDRSAGLHQDVIVMGGVPYPAPTLRTGLPYSRSAVIEVNIGAVDFVPAREAIQMTPKSTATIRALGAECVEAARVAVENMVTNEAKTPRDALRLMVKWRDLLGVTNAKIEFDGKPVPTKFDGDWIMSSATSHRLGSATHYGQIVADALVQSMFVVNYSPAKFSAPHKKRLLKAVEDAGMDMPSSFVMTRDADVDRTWIDDAQVLDWEDVRKIKLPRATTTRTGRPTGSYDGYVGRQFMHIQAADIDTTEKVYYYVGSRWQASDDHDFLVARDPKCTVIALPHNRVNKFRKMFPEAIPTRTAIQEHWTTWTASLTKGQLTAMAIDDAGMTATLKAMDATKIDDRELRSAIYVAQRVDLTSVLRARSIFRGVSVNEIALPTFKNPLKPYVLLADRYGVYSRVNHPHSYVYINAVHAALNA